MAAAQIATRMIEQLVMERQSLRAASADAATLEANRKALAHWQLELTRALARDALAASDAAAA